MENCQEFLYKEEFENYTEFLKNIDFEGKLVSLSQKYNNKKILIYGNGIFFDVINENYDLNKYLNICAVSDIRYEKETVPEYKGYKVIKPADIKDCIIDAILVATINPQGIKSSLIKNNLVRSNVPIESIIQFSYKDKVNSAFNKVKSAYEYVMLTCNIFNSLKYYYSLNEAEYSTKNSYLKKLNSLRKDKNKKIRVAFLCEENSKWGYQSIYDEMKTDDCFELLPIINYPVITKDRQEFSQNSNIEFFKKLNIESIDGYDYEKNIFKPLEEFKPDIVFYQQPWYLKKTQMPQEVSKYALTCVVSYGFTTIDVESWGSDAVRVFSGNLWKMFAESDYHNKFYQKAAKLKYKDIMITKGYPKLDCYKTPVEERFEKLWKDENREVKHRIIWAPHHSIDNYGLAMSCFKEQYKYFLDLAERHPEYSFVVKPHPMLRYKCISEKFLTEEEYDSYINEWNSLPNASVYTDGNYFDIFKTSDILITDSSSFLAEYFYSGKPIIFFETANRAGFNEFGLKLKKGFYMPQNTEETETILEKILIKNEDDLYDLRKKIINKEFYYPQNGVGKNIVSYIKSQIGR